MNPRDSLPAVFSYASDLTLLSQTTPELILILLELLQERPALQGLAMGLPANLHSLLCRVDDDGARLSELVERRGRSTSVYSSSRIARDDYAVVELEQVHAGQQYAELTPSGQSVSHYVGGTNRPTHAVAKTQKSVARPTTTATSMGSSRDERYRTMGVKRE